jgi:hypothetical protein
MKNLMLIVLFFPVLWVVESPNLRDITNAIGSGDAQALGQYFDDSVELGILGKDGFYSKKQAISQVQNFFSKHRPASFSQVRNGTPPNKDSQYCIGNLKAGSQTFRVYIYMKTKGGKPLIQELRFDKE